MLFERKIHTHTHTLRLPMNGNVFIEIYYSLEPRIRGTSAISKGSTNPWEKGSCFSLNESTVK